MNNFRAKYRYLNSVTGVIIALCVALFVITTFFPGVGNWLYYYGPLAKIEPYRFVSSAFMHSGLFHLVFNMLALFMLGEQLEKMMGTWRYLLLFFGSVIVGNLASSVFPMFLGGVEVPVVGASGGIFGLFGAMLVISRKIEANSSGILVLLGINFIYGIMYPNISWESHIGGFLGGAVITAVLWKLAQLQNRRRRRRG
ncbi:MAG: rhomboid family intramembrane serine protease [Arcanobacterium sp.]|nr:rhomboid family intramembrane serine protease [Arcanobacterium sp.]